MANAQSRNRKEPPMSSSPELHGSPRPVLILAHPDPTYTATVARSFRRLSWSVQTAQTADEARPLPRDHAPDLISLPPALPPDPACPAFAPLPTNLPPLHVP